MIQEYDIVRLASKSDAVPIPLGTIGTVLMIFEDNPPAYMVEFMDRAGKSLGTFMVPEGNLVVEARPKNT